MAAQNNTENKTFDLSQYEYNFILQELRPLIERYFTRYVNNIKILGIKIINRADNIASVLVFTNEKTLWSFKYKFVTPFNWEVHQLQSSAKPVETIELRNLRSNFIEIQGMSEVEADEACLKFFLESTTCLQKEEHFQRLVESTKAAKLKEEIQKSK